MSKNERQDLVSDDVLLAWYDNIHIPDVVATSGIPTALRFEAVGPDAAPLPWLVVYPTDDINFTKSDEFNRMQPGGHPEIKGHMYPDLAKIDLRICERKYIHNAPGEKPGTHTLHSQLPQTLSHLRKDKICCGIEYVEKLDKAPGFRRATSYNLVSSLTEGASRRLALHEFETANIPWAGLAEARADPRSKELLSKAAVVDEYDYQLVTEAGDKTQAL
ncbi:hypothetical protein H2204_004401 [Knufia peltigerae]|uniref:Uncharacterized protein n=1 Tax=Knufia peltigerae TaxID=1002370 RepID=A0AA38Y7I2_9EURO|nr:hypothetical protein H2204_004401 [Knufia peltigerae]